MAKIPKSTTRKGEDHNNWREQDWEFFASLLKEQGRKSLRSIERFYLDHGIPKSTFYKAVADYKCMKEAHQIAKEYIGIRKEEYCEDNNLSMNSVMAFSLPDFLDRWKSNVEWRAQIKQIVEASDKGQLEEILRKVLQPFDKDRKDEDNE